MRTTQHYVKICRQVNLQDYQCLIQQLHYHTVKILHYVITEIIFKLAFK